MNCKICGKPSGFFPLCKSCNEKKEQGLIIKCEECGTWHYANQECPSCNSENEIKNRQTNTKTEKAQFCLICNEKVQKNSLCSSHYKEMLDIKTTLFNMDIDELDLYYYNLDNYLYRYRHAENYSHQALKLIAIAYVFREKFNDNSYINKAYKRIEYLNQTKKEEKEKQNEQEEKNQNIEESKDKQKRAEREIEKTIYTEDNHKVRSIGEQIIDDLLFGMGKAHCYEYEIPYDIDIDKKYCDWFIPVLSTDKGIYIEYWGIDDKPNYIKNRKTKEELYTQHNIAYIGIEKEEINHKNRLKTNLIKELNEKAKKYFGVDNFIKY